MALDLVRGLSRKSWVSKRLWRTIRVLKEVAPKLGLATQSSAPLRQDEDEDEEDEDRSAAVAMAGLRAGGCETTGLFSQAVQQNQNQQHGLAAQMGLPSPWNLPAASPDGNGMVQDLSSLFEATAGSAAAGGSNGFGNEGAYGINGVGYGIGGGSAQQQQQQQGAGTGNMDAGNATAMDMGMMGVFGGEDELSRIMRDLF